MGRTRAGLICYLLARGTDVRMRSLLVLGLAGLVTALPAACGSKPSALSPSLGVSTITGLTLSVSVAGVGSTVQQAGMLALSNGHVVAAPSGYTSDTPSVATITPAGAMTGISIGDVTISVEYQGFRASQKVRVLPSYNGTFSGTYTIDSCVDNGGYGGVTACAALAGNFPVGSTPPIVFANAQSTDLKSLTGQFQFLTGFVGNGSGTIAPAGGLTYAGSIISGGTWRMDFRNFTATSTSVGHIGGHFEMVWTDSTQTGSSVWSCTIVDLAR